ncbi:MAG: protoporphyrinogen oxidase HemJ [Rickettsiaceae bacterium]
MAQYYLWFKSAHIISVISWMAAMFYLPRIYVYHTQVQFGSEQDKMFQIMEERLLRIIMNPAMISTYVFGFLTAYIYGFGALGEIWFEIKFIGVIGLTLLHALFAKWRKDFKNDKNKHSTSFFRIINEVPVLLMIIIVVMVTIKPFE